MKEQHCYVALDYLEELRLFHYDRDFTNRQMRTVCCPPPLVCCWLVDYSRVPLPPTFRCACVEWAQVAAPTSGPAPIEKVISEEEQQRRTQARREQGLRLKAMAENRRKEKVGSCPLRMWCVRLLRGTHISWRVRVRWCVCVSCWRTCRERCKRRS